MRKFLNLSLVFLLAFVFNVSNAHPETPEGMVLVPGGEIKIGISKKKLKYITRTMRGAKKDHLSARPVHKVDIKPFYIDIYEVTNEKYAKFLNAKKQHKDGEKLWINLSGVADEGDEKCRIKLDGGSYKVESGYEKYPVIFVSWYGASAYAEWEGKRLPTEQEWEKAARGEEKYLFPWGNSYKRKYANCSDGGPKKTVPVGTYSSRNISPFGCHDMAGNVLEWTSSEYLPYPKSRFKDEFYSGGDYGERYVARGGSWFVRGDECVTTKRFRYKKGVTFEDVGFRCAKDVK